jgi:DivIVA domain-containing protein
MATTLRGPVLVLDPSTITVEQIKSARFTTTFRGYDAAEVKQHLDTVAQAYQLMLNTEAELRAHINGEALPEANPFVAGVRTVDLRSVDTRADLRTVDLRTDGVVIVDAERAETSESQEITPEVTENELLTNARREAEEMLSAARNEANALVAKANDEAARIILRARAESRGRSSSADGMAVVEAALNDSQGDPTLAREQARMMIEEAKVVRERILTDLSKRRRVAHVQLEQMRVAREKLVESLREAKRRVDDASRDLSTAEVEARIAADAAGRRVNSEPLPTAAELEMELLNTRHLDSPLQAQSNPPAAVEAPVVVESVGEAPVVEDVVVEAPVVVESVVEAPVVESVVEAPVVEDVVVEAPVVVESVVEAPVVESVVEAPVVEDVVVEAPVVEDVVVEDVVFEVPVVEDVVVVDVVIEAPVVEDVVVEAPVVDDAVVEEPVVADTSVVEALVVEALVVEAPVAEDVAYVAYVADEVTEPVVDTPAAEVPVAAAKPNVEELFARLRREREEAAQAARKTLGTEPVEHATPATVIDLTTYESGVISDDGLTTSESAKPAKSTKKRKAKTDRVIHLLDSDGPAGVPDVDAFNPDRDDDFAPVLRPRAASGSIAAASHAASEVSEETQLAYVLGPLREQLVRSIKRVLQDEQSNVLSVLRTSRTRIDLDRLVGDSQEHPQRFYAVVEPAFGRAFRAGVDRQDGALISDIGVIEGPTIHVESTSVCRSIVDALRSDLRTELELGSAPEYDTSTLINTVSSHYRTWNTERLSELVEPALRAVYAAGVAAPTNHTSL